MTTRDQGRRERRRSERRVRRFSRKTWVLIGAITIAVTMIAGILIMASGDGESEDGRFPQIGDHWHASYSITICEGKEPPFPVSDGGVHTHGSGAIHLHPKNSSEAGKNANLARFIAGTGSRLTDRSIEFPSGVKLTNGDPCPDGQTGKMFLRVNNITMPAIASYVPRDGDIIELGYEKY